MLIALQLILLLLLHTYVQPLSPPEENADADDAALFRAAIGRVAVHGSQF